VISKRDHFNQGISLLDAGHFTLLRVKMRFPSALWYSIQLSVPVTCYLSYSIEETLVVDRATGDSSIPECSGVLSLLWYAIS